jgi:hypothetical protein
MKGMGTSFGAEGGIVSGAVAQVIDGLGNPLVIPGDSQLDPFSSVRFSLPLIRAFLRSS